MVNIKNRFLGVVREENKGIGIEIQQVVIRDVEERKITSEGLRSWWDDVGLNIFFHI
jgi:hypothetical protein